MVDREEKRGENKGGTGVLKEHGQKNSEKRKEAQSCSIAQDGRARSVEHVSRVQESGTVVPGSRGWPCQFSGSNFQSAKFWHGSVKWHKVRVSNFWFHVFGPFVEF